MQELLCNALKLYRTFPTKHAHEDFCWGMISLNQITGFVEPANPSTNNIVLGCFERFTNDDQVVAKTGVFICDNSKIPELKITLEDIGKPCSVETQRSVCKYRKSTVSQTIAGIVRNVYENGVIVEIGTMVF